MLHPLLASLRIPERGKVVSAREAVSLIRAGDTLATDAAVTARLVAQQAFDTRWGSPDQTDLRTLVGGA